MIASKSTGDGAADLFCHYGYEVFVPGLRYLFGCGLLVLVACVDSTGPLEPPSSTETPADATISTDAGLGLDAETMDVGVPPPEADAALPPDTGCVPQSCDQQAVECGAIQDGCGQSLDCGPCGTWSAMSTLNAPDWARLGVTAWTGEDMFVFGGTTGRGPPSPLAALYNPQADTWRDVSPANAPPPTLNACSAVVLGEVFVWGGYRLDRPEAVAVDEGGLYDPGTDTWRRTSRVGAPSPRGSAACVAIGGRVLVFGGARLEQSDGAIYDPQLDTWQPMAPAPVVVDFPDAVVMGSELVTADAWMAYDPALDTWRRLSPHDTNNAVGVGLAWTGTQLFAFGGSLFGSSVVDDTRSYDPQFDAWTDYVSQDGPSARVPAITVWTGQDVIVWGCSTGRCGDGYHFDPEAGRWTAMPREQVLAARAPRVVWTGAELLVLTCSAFDGQNVARRYRPN